ncbi:hypothetical protein PIB30_082689 [Stylosanthes scabra]|uniref:Transmembrane protein n=1 Tax=Stylosanthes scabra TaxID=79078 RepID=A0ABU6QSN8_9FABA|nr:hypothetical protein [Stylosanthes scabra]
MLLLLLIILLTTTTIAITASNSTLSSSSNKLNHPHYQNLNVKQTISDTKLNPTLIPKTPQKHEQGSAKWKLNLLHRDKVTTFNATQDHRTRFNARMQRDARNNIPSTIFGGVVAGFFFPTVLFLLLVELGECSCGLLFGLVMGEPSVLLEDHASGNGVRGSDSGLGDAGTPVGLRGTLQRRWVRWRK